MGYALVQCFERLLLAFDIDPGLEQVGALLIARDRDESEKGEGEDGGRREQAARPRLACGRIGLHLRGEDVARIASQTPSLNTKHHAADHKCPCKGIHHYPKL